jgi:hypothetical protein
MAVLPNTLLIDLVFSLASSVRSLTVLRAWSELYS